MKKKPTAKPKSKPKRQPKEDFNQAAFRAVQETIKTAEQVEKSELTATDLDTEINLRRYAERAPGFLKTLENSPNHDAVLALLGRDEEESPKKR
jgi:hypothetical protein